MRSIAERIGEPFRKRNVGYGSSKTVQHDVTKILYFSHNRPFVLQIFISLYIGCSAYEEKNIFGKVLLILRLYKYVYMCELTLFLINWQLCYP